MKPFCLLLVITLAVTACSSPVPPPTLRPIPTPVAKLATQPSPTTVAAATATLAVQAEPTGAQVAVNGQPAGRSPVTLTLAAGDHQVTLRAEGYATLTETLTLTVGQQGIYSPTLRDIAPPTVTLTAEPRETPWLGHVQVHAAATDNTAVAELQVVLDGQLLGSAAGGELALELTPAAVAGLAPGSTYTLTARAADAAGNAGQVSLPLIIGSLPKSPLLTATPSATSATPRPTPTITRTPSPTVSASASPTGTASPMGTPAPAVSYRVTEISIPTYPYTAFLRSAIDPARGEFPLMLLDRTAYEASGPQPVPVTYTLIVLENRYLRLSLLPDLGGRVYECIFKPTGNNEFYRNPVIKPTHWGPPSPPYPAGANWWLAAGGLEWGFPVEEHGYLWGTRWGYDPVTNPDGSVTVMLFTGEFTRPYATVAITLPAEAAYFIARPTVTNPNAVAFRFKWWANAMLAPGAANAPGPELRFIFPANEMTVHSTGDETLPGPGQPLAWPTYKGRDLSRLGNWQQYLGFFQRPAAAGGFAGVYDIAADEGMVRVYPADIARGAKGFAMGWQTPIDWHEWTDDGSGYVELQGGLAPTFDDWYELPPGDQVSWSETWYPAAAIGGVTYAAAGGALNLAPAGNSVRIGVFPTKAVTGQLKLTLPGLAPINRPVTINPAKPFNETFSLTDTVPAQGEVSLSLTDARGEVVLAWRGTVKLR